MNLIGNLLLSILFYCICCTNSKIITTANGQISGRTLLTKNNQEYDAYQGIPYAKPPIGSLRFQPPEGPDSWCGIFNATSDNKICYQFDGKDFGKLQEGEDCLYLSIYVPAISNNGSGLPVMVWIYGGGFIQGSYSSALYDPEYFMDHNVIVVTLNYRMGVFGFLSTEDLVVPGNMGLKDQLFAIKWIKDNVKNVGGDPDKITIFGESAGATSISYILLNKKAEGLFRAAISQSGTALNPFGFEAHPKKLAYQTAEHLENFHLVSNSTNELVDFLRAAKASDLHQAAYETFKERYLLSAENLLNGNGFVPVLEPEHEGAFLTKSMFDLMRNGEFVRVPQIIGFNSEEALMHIVTPEFMVLLNQFDKDLTTLIPASMKISEGNRSVVADFIRFLYCKHGTFSNNPVGGIKYLSDTTMIRPIIKTAELQSPYADAYFYRFAYDGYMGQTNISYPGLSGVGHFEDIFYLWKNADSDKPYPEEDQRTRLRLLTMWTNFAKTLDPTPDKTDLFQQTRWPTVTSQGNDSFVYYNINENLTVRNYPREENYRVWEFLYSYYATPIFVTY